MNNSLNTDYLNFFNNNWGSHICHLYNNQDELLEIIVPYLIKGLKENEACVWVVSEPLTIENARQIMETVYPGLADAEKQKQILFISYKNKYLDKYGEVKPTEEILHEWLELEEKSLRRGFNGIRVTGAVNFLTNKNAWKNFMNYECFVCENLNPHKIKAICSYPLIGNENTLNVADVVMNHQAILSKRDGEWIFSENPQNKVTRQLREQEEKLKNLTNQLSNSNEELARFAFVASHDLKEPIRMVSCFTGMLEKKYKDILDEDGLKYLHFSRNGAQRAYKLINNLLEFTSINNENITKQPVDLNKVLEIVLENLNLKIQERNAQIVSDLLPEIEGSETLLGQLFQNLISNAIKFAANQKPVIKISYKIKKNSVIISFKDNGIGIENDFIPDLFSPFKKYHNKTEYEGDGIGLAICKKIIEKHDGKIWAESNLNKGTIFHVEFPYTNMELIKKKEWKEVLKNPAPGHHIAQIYRDSKVLAEMVAFYASSALKLNHAAVIVARDSHLKLFNRALKKNYIDIEKYTNDGQLIFISAEQAKTNILKDNKINRENFESTFSHLLNSLNEKYNGVKVFGEIVDLLASEGDHASAFELESFWNELLLQNNFSLFCAYHEDHIKGADGLTNISMICTQHNELIPSAVPAD